jgi:hypothetical protein
MMSRGKAGPWTKRRQGRPRRPLATNRLMSPSDWNLSRWFNCCACDWLVNLPAWDGCQTMKQSLSYEAVAAAIAVAVWAISGAPMLSHPDSRVAQSAGHH